jgi:hypothetical protein
LLVQFKNLDVIAFDPNVVNGYYLEAKLDVTNDKPQASGEQQLFFGAAAVGCAKFTGTDRQHHRGSN